MGKWRETISTAVSTASVSMENSQGEGESGKKQVWGGKTNIWLS